MRRALAMRLILLACATCLGIPGMACAKPQISKTITASQGIVGATLNYMQGADRYGNPTYSKLRVRITRSGRTVYAAAVHSPGCGFECWPETQETSVGNKGPLTVEYLQPGEPDVILNLYTGGAHCCSIVQVFHYDPSVSTYRQIERNFGDPGALLSDLAGDGRLEFLSADDRFAYEFTSYAYSGLPRQIWRFSADRFLDVTREFPGLVAADAKRQFKQFLANRRQGFGLGFIAAWAADEDLLGHRAVVTSRLNREARKGYLRSADHLTANGSVFLAKLKRFLKKTGYT